MAPSVPAEKIFALGLVVAPVLVVLYLCSLIFLSRYRITRESHARTLAEVERRRLERCLEDGFGEVDEPPRHR